MFDDENEVLRRVQEKRKAQDDVFAFQDKLFQELRDKERFQSLQEAREFIRTLTAKGWDREDIKFMVELLHAGQSVGIDPVDMADHMLEGPDAVVKALKDGRERLRSS